MERRRTSAACAARPARRADAPLSARLSLLLQSARARRRDDELDTATWARVFTEAAALGVLQVHLSGGEPAARRDLVEIVAARARRRALHQPHHLGGRHHHAHACANLPRPASITCRSRSRTATRHPPTTSPAIEGAFARKHALAAEVVRLGLPLTVNVVMHRANIERIDDMVDSRAATRRQPRRDRACAVLRLGAEEPRRADADARAGRRARCARSSSCAQASRPDRHRRRGAGLLRALSEALRRRLGPALAQRHAVRPGAAVPRRRNHSRASSSGTCASIRSPTSGETSPAFKAFRGTDWMPEPCRSCERREDRFRRLPLPGLPADRRRPRDRPGVPSVAASCSWSKSWPRCAKTIAYDYRRMLTSRPNCRLPIARRVQLSDTCPKEERSVAPFADLRTRSQGPPHREDSMSFHMSRPALLRLLAGTSPAVLLRRTGLRPATACLRSARRALPAAAASAAARLATDWPPRRQ